MVWCAIFFILLLHEHAANHFAFYHAVSDWLNGCCSFYFFPDVVVVAVVAECSYWWYARNHRVAHINLAGSVWENNTKNKSNWIRNESRATPYCVCVCMCFLCSGFFVDLALLPHQIVRAHFLFHSSVDFVSVFVCSVFICIDCCHFRCFHYARHRHRHRLTVCDRHLPSGTYRAYTLHILDVCSWWITMRFFSLFFATHTLVCKAITVERLNLFAIEDYINWSVLTKAHHILRRHRHSQNSNVNIGK